MLGSGLGQKEYGTFCNHMQRIHPYILNLPGLCDVGFPLSPTVWAVSDLPIHSQNADI